MKISYLLIKNKERNNVFLRLRLLDELCHMDHLHEIWKTYYEISIQHQLCHVSKIS